MTPFPSPGETNRSRTAERARDRGLLSFFISDHKMKNISSFSIMSIFIFLIYTGNCFSADMSFYVSAKGNDSWSGKLAEPLKNGSDGPFATLEKARDAIRTLKKTGNLAKGTTVLIKSGVY